MFSHYCYSLADPYTHVHSNSSSPLWAKRGAKAGTHRRPDVCRDYKNRLGLSKSLISPPFLHCSSQNKHIISWACWGLLATEKERKIEQDGEREKMLLAWLGDALCIPDRISSMWFMAPRGWAEPGGWRLLSSKGLQFATVKKISRLCLEEEKVTISIQERIASCGSSVPAAEGIAFLA